MRTRTNDLEGAALDRAVALAEGRTTESQNEFAPSTNGALAGEIIDREDIWLAQRDDQWLACIYADDSYKAAHQGTGPTPLIAAMRAFVISKFGDDIDL
jgi:hypothetical protein